MKKLKFPGMDEWIINRRRHGATGSEITPTGEPGENNPAGEERRKWGRRKHQGNYGPWTAGVRYRRLREQGWKTGNFTLPKWPRLFRPGLADPERDVNTRTPIWRWVGQIGAALLLLAAVYGLFQLQHPWAVTLQNEVRRYATEDAQFPPLREAVQRLGLWTDVLSVAPVMAPPGGPGKSGLPVTEPVKGIVVQVFGVQGVEFSPGIRIAAPAGSPVTAGTSGKIAAVWDEGGGRFLLITAVDTGIRIMGPLEDVTVKPGQTVEPGTILGKLAREEAGHQSQLYLEIRRGGRCVDPLGDGGKKEGLADENSPPGGGGNLR
ncbi:MAG: M23 family metallopeptidase [Heliobacteriaceae bacterium]|nr:M23 family metallopeptidase [Heliobacteriaceae bacterium]MDD4586909.1 M23 family metallopeptidase [Heliobacteriaceae bacterium]